MATRQSLFTVKSGERAQDISRDSSTAVADNRLGTRLLYLHFTRDRLTGIALPYVSDASIAFR